MHADDPLRPAAGRAEAGDRDRRGIGREDYLGRAELVQAREQIELHGLDLSRSFDHEVGRLQGFQPGCPDDVGANPFPDLGSYLPTSLEPLHHQMDGAEGGIEDRL